MALKAVFAVLNGNFPADKPIGMLARIKVVQRPLKVERSRTVPTEHHHEGGIPHEGAIVESRVDEVGNQRACRGGLANVAERDFPCFPVTSKSRLMAVSAGSRQLVFGKVEIRQRGLFLWKCEKHVFLKERVANMGVRPAHRP